METAMIFLSVFCIYLLYKLLSAKMKYKNEIMSLENYFNGKLDTHEETINQLINDNSRLEQMYFEIKIFLHLQRFSDFPLSEVFFQNIKKKSAPLYEERLKGASLN